MYRDDGVAARERVDVLERELEASQQEVEQLKLPKRPSWWRRMWSKLTGRPQPKLLSWDEFPCPSSAEYERFGSPTYRDGHHLSAKMNLEVDANGKVIYSGEWTDKLANDQAVHDQQQALIRSNQVRWADDDSENT